MLAPLRTVLWCRHDLPGSEYLTLWSDGMGWQLRGTVVSVLNDLPTRVRYGMGFDADWTAQSAHIALRSGGPERALHLVSSGDSQWTVTGKEGRPVGAYPDLDLDLSPASVTALTRRLRLPIGEAVTLSVLKVRFPQLRVDSAQHTLTRLAATRYHLQTPEYGEYIEVDDLGLVCLFGDRWSRAATAY